MKRRVVKWRRKTRPLGAWTLRFARGPGRQSGLWAISFAALAALPALALLQPACASDGFTCTPSWNRLFFVPRLLMVPAALGALLMFGAWRAQRSHARVERRYFERLVAAEEPDIPPGHFEAKPLEQDLVKRTLRGLALGAVLGTILLGAAVATPIGWRACDPIPSNSGLAPCSTALQWTDALLAFEVVGFLLVAGTAAIVFYTRSTSIRVEGLPKRRRMRRGLAGRA